MRRAVSLIRHPVEVESMLGSKVRPGKIGTVSQVRRAEAMFGKLLVATDTARQVSVESLAL